MKLSKTLIILTMISFSTIISFSHQFLFTFGLLLVPGAKVVEKSDKKDHISCFFILNKRNGKIMINYPGDNKKYEPFGSKMYRYLLLQYVDMLPTLSYGATRGPSFSLSPGAHASNRVSSQQKFLEHTFLYLN